ncbi:HD-GYP domain-containing protein [Paenibacillus sp. Marseille-Q4541]|uniref:HD-GYP domain-containing protein n=1 Tax=Paenibacillus sp. Marseille-Q4541 TaxID=2831522 RepID=UPI0020197170|nr:HD-GYP domain-containing protein [Paenibacillus sp. Marseille-Q4541]
MRLVSITMLEPGMKLGKRIYNEEGIVLLGEQIELTSHLIKRLSQLGISYVYIHDPGTEDIEFPELLREETRIRALKEIKKQFSILSGGKMKNQYPYLGKVFTDVMEMILEDISSHSDVMIMMSGMHTMDHALYDHSLNVCIYSLILAKALGYEQSKLMELGLGALLHDIGKTQIPSHILQKPGKLSQEEYEIVKNHTLYGFRLLKDEPGIPLLSAHCALQHHERLDGQGYPQGLRGHEIHEYGKLLALTDSYDAMTTNRVYQNALLPHQAVEMLFAGTGTLYDQRILEVFRDYVAIYPVGLTVQLTTGDTAVVVRIHREAPHRPVVRIIKDQEGRKLDAPYDLDLLHQLSVMITGVGEEMALSFTSEEPQFT